MMTMRSPTYGKVSYETKPNSYTASSIVDKYSKYKK